MNILSQQIIKGYEIHECIGQGGFGAVYRAYQPVIDREVSIKVILPQYANQPDFIRRFEVEAQLIARLEHLHIVPLYDYWRDLDGAYLVMRYLRGGNLKDWIAQGALDPGESLRLVEQIAQALAVAHRQGVVHRDIKPSNILLDEERNAYLADFGIAKVLGGEPSIEGLRGTLDYISPEQIRSQPVTPQTDIYALGIVLYEMLTGMQPFSPASTPAELLQKHLETPLPDVRSARTELPGAVNEVIQTATAKAPSERYPDAPGLAHALREALAAVDLAPAVVEQPLIEPLTDRELDVLHLMAEGLTNGEIASRLVIALSTVKWYVQQINGKLGVGNRRQAVAAGQRLGLLEGAVRRDIALPDWMVGHNPYKGLAAFQRADSADYFGRKALVAQIVARLAENDSLARFLAVVGPSGSGKSSVVRAGLLPALALDAVSGARDWFVVDMLPGGHPLDQLEIALGRVATQHLPGIMEQLQRDARGLLRVTNLILPEDGQLLLVIDQFEELFTMVDDPAVIRRMLDLIHAAVTDPRSRARVIVTLRADFYDRPLTYPNFVDLMRHRTEVVGPLTPEELEQAIVKPAELAGVTVEPGLVAALVAEVHEQPGTLPLLEYALTELFDRRQGRTMTLATYQVIGGALGALTRQADEVYDGLSKAEQDAARQGFLRLVTLGEGTEDVRRRVPLSELTAIAAPGDGMGDVLDLFGSYRLLTFDCDPATREPTVEVAHEALIQRWERLREWIDASRADIRQQRLLAAAAVEWEQAGRERSYLLHGTRLVQLEDWAAHTDLALTPGEREFVDASMTEHQRQRARRRRLRNGVLAVAIAVAAIMTVLALVAVNQRATAQEERENTQRALIRAEREAAVNESLVVANSAQKQLDNGYTELALALALKAVEMDEPPAESVRILTSVAYGPGSRAVLLGHPNAVRAVAFSPDGAWGLSGSCATLDSTGTCTDGELILWDLRERAERRRFGGQDAGGHSDWVNGIAFDPASTTSPTALSASEDGSLILWNAATGEPVRRFEGHTGGVNAVAFGWDGQTFLSGSDDSTILLWDTTTGEVLRRFEGHTAGVNSVALNPDGRTFISGSDDKTVLLWDVTTGDILQRFEGHTDKVTAVVFQPNPGGEVVSIWSTSADFTLRYWDLNTAQEIYQYNYIAYNRCLAVTPDGRMAAVCADLPIRLWDINGQRELYRLIDFTDQPSTKYSVAISADGLQVMAGSEDGSIRVWNRDVQPVITRFELKGVQFSSVSVSPDGRSILTGTATGEAILWDMAQGSEVRRFDVGPGVVALAEFTPDGRYALAGFSDWFGGTNTTGLVLWDVETGQELHRLEGQHFFVRSMAISPDGRLALTGSQKYPFLTTDPERGDLILWDLSTGKLVRRFDTKLDVVGVAFSADGSRAITCSLQSNLSDANPDLILWDVATGFPIRSFKGNTMGTSAVVFGPDDKTALSASGNGTLLLWDVETGMVLRRFVGHEDAVFSLDLSPDGRYVMSGDWSGTVIVWNFTTGQELRRFQAHQGTVSRVAFSPDGQTAFSAPLADSTVIQWQVGEQSMGDVLAWVRENRYVRDFTCEERAQYRIEPLCG